MNEEYSHRPMYRPSMYGIHDESLSRFADLFNTCDEYKHILIEPITKETFDNDGDIKNINTGQSIGFDWEYRDRYFSNCKFSFDTLGQYERKLIKPSIDLSLQCDSTQTGVIVAWHEDWLLENRITRSLSTDTNDQLGTVRYTHSFKIFSYEEISNLKEMIDNAFRLGEYNRNSF